MGKSDLAHARRQAGLGKVTQRVELVAPQCISLLEAFSVVSHFLTNFAHSGLGPCPMGLIHIPMALKLIKACLEGIIEYLNE